MAYDKVVDSTFLDGGLTLIADAIREKNGSEDELLFPDDFVTAIGAIEGGGGGDIEARVYFYEAGEEHKSETGGWSGINIRSDEGWKSGSLTKGESSMTLKVNNSSYAVASVSKINLSALTELRIVIASSNITNVEFDEAFAVISTVRSTATDSNPAKLQPLYIGTNGLEVSNLNSNYYIAIDATSDYSRSLEIKAIYGVTTVAALMQYSEDMRRALEIMEVTV